MNDLITEIGAALEYYAGQERENAAEMGCSAGNFDGGSAESCEHCQALAGAAHLEGLLAHLSTVARLAQAVETLNTWIRGDEQRSLEVSQPYHYGNGRTLVRLFINDQSQASGADDDLAAVLIQLADALRAAAMEGEKE